MRVVITPFTLDTRGPDLVSIGNEEGFRVIAKVDELDCVLPNILGRPLRREDGFALAQLRGLADMWRTLG